MQREIITLTEYEIGPIIDECALESEAYESIFDEDDDIIGKHLFQDFRVVEETIKHFDLEKAYVQYRVIVQRISDGKFFEGSYKYSYAYIEYHTILKEVFPRDVSTTLYE